MTRPRTVLTLHAGLVLAGTLAMLAASIAAQSMFTLGVPRGTELWNACAGFSLPQRLSASVIAALVLGGLALATITAAMRSVVRQLRATRSFLAALQVTDVLPRGPVVFADTRAMAFCAGYLRPRVYVSTAALHALTRDQLDAVLAHELHHARGRDPLRVMLTRVTSDALFFVPALRRSAEGYACLAELAADATAVRAHRGDPRPLAAALIAFDAPSGPAVTGVAPERVDHLLGHRPRWAVPLLSIVSSLAGTVLILLAAMRISQAGGTGRPVSLPLLASQLCMAAMVVGLLAVGAGIVLGGRRRPPRLAAA